ncbi:MAG: DUF934 domain-containing protein [Burkholderiales bacterium]|nr:DUF934 domain-containing protein [Burkholderiales bacterium]
MARIIKDRHIVDDNWQLIKPADDGAIPELPDNGDIIVPLDFWLAKKDELRQRRGRTGVWLDSHQEPQLLGQDLPSLPLVAVNFPKFADGRGFSIGRLLRERYHYQGELRAIGDVLRDQILYMHRCGFNAFAVRADKSIEDALKAFNDFSDGYQVSVDRPLPLFRRRLN